MNLDSLFWLPNLDVETEWSRPTPYMRSRHLTRIIEEKSAGWADRFFGDQSHVIPMEGDWTAPPGARAIAWSPSQWAQDRCRELGVPLLGSLDPDLAKRVNHKAFVLPIRDDFAHMALPKFSVGSEEELREHLAQWPAHLQEPQVWLVRRPFGAAARAVQRIPVGRLGQREEQWLKATGGPWVLEPWVPIVWEASTCGWVFGPNRWDLAQPRIQEVDEQGQWTGSRSGFAPLSAHRTELEEGAGRCAGALASAGYRGPFGVDSFLFRGHSNRLLLNPIGDCNARFTMSWPDAYSIRSNRNGPDLSWFEPYGGKP